VCKYYAVKNDAYNSHTRWELLVFIQRQVSVLLLILLMVFVKEGIMSIHPRRFLLSLACALVLAAVLVAPLVSSPVSAGGAQPVLPGGSSLKPGEATLIQLSAENVTMNIRPATEADNTLLDLGLQVYTIQRLPAWFPAIAEVETDFTLKNPTAEAITLTVWFPLASALDNVDWKLYPERLPPRMESFQVNVAGKKVAYASSDLPNPGGADKPPLPWASFPVTFPGGAETLIHVSYKISPQPFMGTEMALYYVFQTGAGWAGPIGRVDLTLNLPYPASSQTIAGMPSSSLHLPPYYRASAREDFPPNSKLEGNQAHFCWQGIEPGPGDDFAVWLLQPAIWQELETARAAVQADQQDGRLWLDLASTYTNHLGTEFNNFSIFLPSFLPAGIDAYQRAAALLPSHPAPHAGLGLLSLYPYLISKNAPSDVMRFVEDEFHIAQTLDARNPALMKNSGESRQLLVRLANVLDAYFYNFATAEAQDTAQSAVSQTAQAVFLETTSATPTRMTTPTGTPTLEPTFTSTSIPSSTSQPFTTPSQTAASPEPVERGSWMMTGSGLVAIAILAVGMLVLIIAGYLVYNRSQNRMDK